VDLDQEEGRDQLALAEHLELEALVDLLKVGRELLYPQGELDHDLPELVDLFPREQVGHDSKEVLLLKGLSGLPFQEELEDLFQMEPAGLLYQEDLSQVKKVE